jgi:hypothetical protein
MPYEFFLVILGVYYGDEENNCRCLFKSIGAGSNLR